MKADIHDQNWNHRQFTGWRETALRPIAAVGVILGKWPAYDPKRT